MKNYFFLLAAIGIVAMSFTLKDDEYKLDVQKSKLTWLGKKVTGQHTGTISIAEGTFVAKGGKVTGGSFVIDVTSIKDSENNARLEGHLKSDDFFSAEKFPKANFVITSSIPAADGQYSIKGNLTIKGITNEIEFPATIQVDKNQVTAKAKILVDRTKFDIKFRSGNFFENLGDKVIDDNFELNVELVAGKK